MLPQYDYEILFVNDGSKDNTLNKLTGLSEMDVHVKYYSFSRNFGKEAAIYAGLNNARGDYVVIMDADMQDPPALLPEMISTLESGEYDSVATRRVSRKGEPMVRSFCARCFYKLIRRISDADIVDGARDFRMMTRDMVNSVLALSEYNRFSKGIFGWVGLSDKMAGIRKCRARCRFHKVVILEAVSVLSRRDHSFFHHSPLHCISFLECCSYSLHLF